MPADDITAGIDTGNKTLPLIYQQANFLGPQCSFPIVAKIARRLYMTAGIDAGNKISTLILPPKLQSGYILLEFCFFFF